jgi:hypothetical protein
MGQDELHLMEMCTFKIMEEYCFSKWLVIVKLLMKDEYVVSNEYSFKSHIDRLEEKEEADMKS